MKLLTKNLLTLEGRKKELKKISKHLKGEGILTFNTLTYQRNEVIIFIYIFLLNNDFFDFSKFELSKDMSKIDFCSFVNSVCINSYGIIHFSSLLFNVHFSMDFVSKKFLGFFK